MKCVDFIDIRMRDYVDSSEAETKEVGGYEREIMERLLDFLGVPKFEKATMSGEIFEKEFQTLSDARVRLLPLLHRHKIGGKKKKRPQHKIKIKARSRPYGRRIQNKSMEDEHRQKVAVLQPPGLFSTKGSRT